MYICICLVWTEFSKYCLVCFGYQKVHFCPGLDTIDVFVMLQIFFWYKTLPTGCIWIRESTLIPFLRFSMNLYSLTSVRNLVIFGIWVLFHLQNFCLKKFLFEKKGCVLGSKSFIFGQKCFIYCFYLLPYLDYLYWQVGKIWLFVYNPLVEKATGVWI